MKKVINTRAVSPAETPRAPGRDSLKQQNAQQKLKKTARRPVSACSLNLISLGREVEHSMNRNEVESREKQEAHPQGRLEDPPRPLALLAPRKDEADERRAEHRQVAQPVLRGAVVHGAIAGEQSLECADLMRE